MSNPFGNQPNPYASPVMPPAGMPIVPVGPPPGGLEYMRAYNYIFESPEWMTTVLLMGLLCIGMFIPGVSILLQLLFIGYQFVVIDSLLASGGRAYPTFEFGKLGDYITRGIWPFLVSLVAMMVLLPVIYGGMFAGIFAIAGISSAAGDDLGAVLGVVLGSIGGLIFFAVMLLAVFYLSAMTIRSGLSQDFVSAFQFQWVNDFVRKMWLEMLLGALFLGVTAFFLEIVGLLALCVGLLFVIPLFFLAQAHLMYQLYGLYLARGGMPVISSAGSTQYKVPPPMPPGFPPKPPM